MTLAGEDSEATLVVAPWVVRPKVVSPVVNLRPVVGVGAGTPVVGVGVGTPVVGVPDEEPVVDPVVEFKETVTLHPVEV